MARRTETPRRAVRKKTTSLLKAFRCVLLLRPRTTRVDLNDTGVLELALKPDFTPSNALATLVRWRVVYNRSSVR
jgi:hypothetical protein